MTQYTTEQFNRILAAARKLVDLGYSPEDALAESEEEERVVYATPLRDMLERSPKRILAADSVRPEHLWGTEREPSSTTAMPVDAQNFWVGRRWGLDKATGEWRAFTDEEQARGWMSLPTGFVAVTAVDREAGEYTFTGVDLARDEAVWGMAVVKTGPDGPQRIHPLNWMGRKI